MAKFATHAGDPHGDRQTSPKHADPHEIGAFLKITIQEIHVDRCVVGGKFRHGLLESHEQLL